MGKMLVTFTFIGHVGTEHELAGAGIACMTSNILAFSITIGLACTLGTLLSQAIGKKDYELCGVYLNRCGILIFCLFTASLIPLQFGENFFLMMDFDAHSAQYAQRFIYIILPSIIFISFNAA